VIKCDNKGNMLCSKCGTAEALPSFFYNQDKNFDDVYVLCGPCWNELFQKEKKFYRKGRISEEFFKK